MLSFFALKPSIYTSHSLVCPNCVALNFDNCSIISENRHAHEMNKKSQQGYKHDLRQCQIPDFLFGTSNCTHTHINIQSIRIQYQNVPTLNVVK